MPWILILIWNPFSCLEADDPVDATYCCLRNTGGEDGDGPSGLNLQVPAVLTGRLENTVDYPFHALSGPDREILGWAVTNYRASEWIYPWMR